MLVDVHCHLDHPDYDDLELVLQRAKEAGVVKIVSNGLNENSNQRVLDLAKRYDIIKPALGLYPTCLLERDYEGYPGSGADIEKITNQIKNNDIAAVGEIGLDYIDVSDEEKAIMKAAFVRMIRLAKEKNIPVIIHSRKAELECIEILEQEQVKKVIMHCFTGKLALVKRIAKNGWYLSIPTAVVRNEQFQNNVKAMPLCNILTETDGPYMAPEPRTRNESANISKSIKTIAKLKGIDEKEAIQAVFMNYQRVFN